MAIPATNMTVAFVFIDTIILAGKSDPKNMFSSPHGPDSQRAADDEWKWIDQTLAEYSKPGSGVGWIFVAGHYPGIYEYCALMQYFVVASTVKEVINCTCT